MKQILEFTEINKLQWNNKKSKSCHRVPIANKLNFEFSE